jgi:phosphate transport system substrate-binding protein
MKTNIITVCLIMVNSMVAFAQQETGVVKLRGTRLTYPLVRKWITEFKKEYPGINVFIAPQAPADSIDFNILAYALTSDGQREAIVVSRYIQLPVANNERPGLANLQAKGLTEQNLRDLFFSPSTPSFLASSQSQTPIALYVRDKPVCAVKAFATHFGDDPKQIKGIGVNGDDQDLAEAVRKDINGLSFNNLGFIYNVTTRKISEGLAVIPLDLDENGKIDKEEQIYSDLDHVITFIEKTHHSKFVNEEVNFVFDKNANNTSAGIFLNWVLTTGQKFNHDLGFLSVDPKALDDQRKIVASSFHITSNTSCESGEKLMRKRKLKLTTNEK